VKRRLRVKEKRGRKWEFGQEQRPKTIPLLVWKKKKKEAVRLQGKKKKKKTHHQTADLRQRKKKRRRPVTVSSRAGEKKKKGGKGGGGSPDHGEKGSRSGRWTRKRGGAGNLTAPGERKKKRSFDRNPNQSSGTTFLLILGRKKKKGKEGGDHRCPSDPPHEGEREEKKGEGSLPPLLKVAEECGRRLLPRRGKGRRKTGTDPPLHSRHPGEGKRKRTAISSPK